MGKERDACHVPRTRGKRERRSCPHKVWGHERERLSSPHKVWETREMNVMSPQHIQRNERETSTALHILKPSSHEDRITRVLVEFEALMVKSRKMADGPGAESGCQAP